MMLSPLLMLALAQTPTAIQPVAAQVQLSYAALNTALHQAVRAGDVAGLEALVKAGEPVNATDDAGNAALHLAMNSELPAQTSAQMVLILIQAGADIQARNQNQSTPLALAAEYNQLESTRLLLEHGADVQARDKWQWTPLHSAVNFAKNPQLVALLIEAGADVNATHIYGWSPLHHTANYQGRDEHDLADIAVILLKAGANPNLAGKEGLSPLAFAAKNNKPDTLQTLVENGANVDQPDNQGWTPLMHAVAYSQNPELVGQLLQAGANPGAKTREGDTAMTLANSLDTANAENKERIQEMLAKAKSYQF